MEERSDAVWGLSKAGNGGLSWDLNSEPFLTRRMGSGLKADETQKSSQETIM